MNFRHCTKFLSALALLFVFVSCDKTPMPPPVSVTYRNSFWGRGKVVQVTNTSNNHLYNVKVIGRNFQEVSSASVRATDHLSPGSSVEVGWIQFEQWTPQPGETIEIYADDYLTPYVSRIPK